MWKGKLEQDKWRVDKGYRYIFFKHVFIYISIYTEGRIR